MVNGGITKYYKSQRKKKDLFLCDLCTKMIIKPCSFKKKKENFFMNGDAKFVI